MFILGIETSCDDTSAAVVEDGRIIKSNVISNQTLFHKEYGGIVPEIASRKHIENILPVVYAALKDAKVRAEDLSAVAVTFKPGLIGSLIVGVAAAKSLSYAWKLPLIGINHLEAHLYANFFEKLKYPEQHLALLVSGGHTMLVRINDQGQFSIVGGTVDDAAGEAFDKAAKLLGLGFPGGPIIESKAAKGDPEKIVFPQPMRDSGDFNFSFSGLKTALRNYLLRNPDYDLVDVCAGFQKSVVEILTFKTFRAVRDLHFKTAAIAGGVAANGALRSAFEREGKIRECRVVYPSPKLCTDNAAMVAGLAYHKLAEGIRHDMTLNAYPSF